MQPGDIVPWQEVIQREGKILQRGMNYRVADRYSILLMSRRPNAPYADRVEEDGRVLVYEGHDIPRVKNGADPKTSDQPLTYPSGTPTQNGLFFSAAVEAKNGLRAPERVRVYEKILSGVWAYNGLFDLVDAWIEESGPRRVCRFKLVPVEELNPAVPPDGARELPHARVIPSVIKAEVWKRDKGRCVLCGSSENLHFDHDIPFSKGGSSLTANNIRLLCLKHNLQKSDRIE